MILTNTRFRRLPSNSRVSHSARPHKIRSQVPKALVSPRRELGRTQSETILPAVRHRDHHGFAWRPMPLQMRVGIAF
jgi:hypothetical protein